MALPLQFAQRGHLIRQADVGQTAVKPHHLRQNLVHGHGLVDALRRRHNLVGGGSDDRAGQVLGLVGDDAPRDAQGVELVEELRHAC